jgi:hypothetical protein
VWTRHTTLKWPQTFVTTRHWAKHRANSTTTQSALTPAISKTVTVWYNSSILGAFAELQKVTISIAMYVCPSVRVCVCPHGTIRLPPSVCPLGTIRLPLDGFSSNFIFEYFSKSVEKIQESLKWERKKRVLYMKVNITFQPYTIPLISFQNKKFSDKSCRKTRNTYFMLNNFFPEKSDFLRQRGKMLYSGECHKWRYGACAWHDGYLRPHTHTHTHTHTHRLCTTQCFCTATMVAWTRLNVTHTLSDLHLLPILKVWMH